MHKRTVLVLLAGAAATTVVGLAGSASGATGNPLCFSGDGGSCTREGKSVHLVAPGAGVGYAGTYFSAKATQGKAAAAVDYSFSYVGDINGGSPRLSIPIDTDGNGGWNDFASIDAQNCGGTDGVPGTVSTASATCPVKLNYAGTSYANWDAFAAPVWCGAYRMLGGSTSRNAITGDTHRGDPGTIGRRETGQERVKGL